MYLVFTRMPGESYCRWLRSLLLCLSDMFWTLINSLLYWFCFTVKPGGEARRRDSGELDSTFHGLHHHHPQLSWLSQCLHLLFLPYHGMLSNVSNLRSVGGVYLFHGVHHHHPQLSWLGQCFIFSFCLTMACSATSLVSERHGWGRRGSYWLTAGYVLLFTNQSVRIALELKNQKLWWFLTFKTKIKIHKWFILTLLFVTR